MINSIINGDCLEELKKLEDNSVDSIVSDPPYGISFMGKKWDYDVPQVEVWQEVLRVLKPGGHALIACGTRTQHRMAINLEDAGFEIRDVISWVYGSGFPKSLNIGKAVDKLQGNERAVLGKTKGNINAMPDGRPSRSDTAWKSEIKQYNITKGNSPYEGWGTALKPAMELWTLCRKPLEGKTVAENILKYGTGGINIDECRVEATKDDMGDWDRFKGHQNKNTIRKNMVENKEDDFAERVDNGVNPQGRFPANLIHDGSDEVVGLFPETKSGGGKKGNVKEGTGMFGSGKAFETEDVKPDSGSASRFFYCAKASKSERNKGLEGFEEKCIKQDRREEVLHTNPVTSRLATHPQSNHHPTVKPIALMRYLCRLITPKNGTVLDPFMGSGSTGIGAKLEGFNFIGIEREEEYCKIAEARIKAYKIK